jgi:glycosyltransferase involved in cell wall biosynthesis
MMQRPLVSVIVPAYNSEKYIRETLDSVCNQLFKDFEVIIVDDGSTDNQRDIILSFCNADPRFRYLFLENQGVSSARNTGYNHSSGSYVAFLDADDVWLPDNLSSKLEKFESGDFGLVHSDASQIDGMSNTIEGVMVGREGELLINMLKWEGTQVPGPSSILVKRSVLQSIGLFDTRLSTSADHDFFLRVASKFKIGHVDKMTWKYRLHGFNMHKRISLMENDVLFVYEKASVNKLFGSYWFERKCYSTMYLILAASWAGDGKNRLRAAYYIFLALISHPASLTNLLNRISKRWI